MKPNNWNKPKINLPLKYDGHPGVRYTQQSGQVSVDDILAELQKMGEITEDVYELLDAAPCEARYGMIHMGFDSRIKLVVNSSAWGVVFGWNTTTEMWSVVRLEPGDGPHTLIRMKNGGMGSITSFHESEDRAKEAMSIEKFNHETQLRLKSTAY